MLAEVLSEIFKQESNNVTSPFESGIDNVMDTINATDKNTILFLDVPNTDFNVVKLSRQLLDQNRKFMVGCDDNSKLRKSLGDLGLNLFKVSGSSTLFGYNYKINIPENISDKVIQIEHIRQVRKALDIYEQMSETMQEKRLVTGVVMEPNAPDMDDDFYKEEDVENAMIDYMCYCKRIGLEHIVDITPDVSIVESFLTRGEYDHGGTTINKGTWMMTVKVHNSKIWEAYKAGTLTGFSLAGVGTATDETE